MILIPWQSFILANNWQKNDGNGFSIIVPWSEGLGRFARQTWWPETCALVEKIKVKNNNKLMLLIVFWKVMSWILLFHLLFWCHKIIFRETSYGTVFGPIWQCWEQTLTIFDDVLLEETAHAQLGHHTRNSWKAWKNSIWWKNVSSYVVPVSCE